MAALYTLWSHMLELKFPIFIGIYMAMKLQYDYQRVKDYYICIASVYLMVMKTMIKNGKLENKINFRPEKN